MRGKITTLCAMLALLTAACSRPAGRAEGAMNAPSARALNVSPPVRLSPESADASEPSVAVGRDGTPYFVWVEHGAGKEADVWLARLDGNGKTVSAAVRVNPVPGEATAWHGDPPTAAVASDGAVHVGWTARAASGGHANTLYLSTSRDGGRSFAAPVRINDDLKPGVHGMHSLALSTGGRIHVAWLDERNVTPPQKAQAGPAHGHKEANREVFFASSEDGGRSFSPNARVASDACPCCKTSLAASPDGRIYVSWRQVLPGEFRHIAVSATDDGGRTFSPPVVVSDDRWQIAGCPVSGSALTAGEGGSLRALWYSAGEAGPPGLYWSESRDGGRTFAPRQALAGGSGRLTPIVLGGVNHDPMAVWEDAGEGGATRISTAAIGLGVSAVVAADEGELPAAAEGGGRLFISYVSKRDERRGVWFVRV